MPMKEVERWRIAFENAAAGKTTADDLQRGCRSLRYERPDPGR